MDYLDEHEEENDFEISLSPPTETEKLISAGAGTASAFGRPTNQSLATRNLIGDRNAERMGYKRDQKGLFEGFADAVNRTTRDVVKGSLKTFGAEVSADAIEQTMRFRKDLDPVEWRESKLGWFGDSLGMGLTESAGMLATTAVGSALGSPATGMAMAMGSTYVRLYGENYERLEKMNSIGVEEGELRGMAMGLTAFQSVVEFGLSIEAGAGRAIGKMISTKSGRSTAERVMADLLKSKEGKSLFRRMGREFYRPTKFTTGAIFGGFGEYSEEVLQELGAIKAEFEVSQKLPSEREFIDRVLIQPLRAIPAGGLMGGVGAMGRAESTGLGDADIRKTSKKDVQEIHSQADSQGVPVMNDKSFENIRRERGLINALRNDILKIKKITPEQADQIANFVLDMAYSMTRLARKHNQGDVLPENFIKELRTVALEDTLKPSDFEAIAVIRQNESDPSKRTQKMLDYLASQYGTRHKFYGAIRSIKQTSEILELRALRAQVLKRMAEQGASPLKNKKARKAFNKQVNVVFNMLTENYPKAITALKAGESQSFNLGLLGNGFLSDAQVAQLYTYGAEIRIGTEKYAVRIVGNRLQVDPLARLDEEQREAFNAQQDELNNRINLVSEPDAIDEMTGTDEALQMEKAEYAITANRMLGMEQFMEYWKDRTRRKPPKATVLSQWSNRTFKGQNVAKTGLELETQARADARTDLSVEDIQRIDDEIDQLGKDAQYLYRFYYMQEAKAMLAEAQADNQARTTNGLKRWRAWITRLETRLNDAVERLKGAGFAQSASQQERTATPLDEEFLPVENIEQVAQQGFAGDASQQERLDPPMGRDVNPQQVQDDNGVVAGMYDGHARLAVFFGNADVGTVIHEIIHHMTGVLPSESRSEIQQSLTGYEGVAEEIENEDWGKASDEALADTINKYISDGILPDHLSSEAVETFNDLREAIGKFTQEQLDNLGYELSPETKAYFDEFFREVSDEEVHGFMADVALDGMRSDGVGANTTQEGVTEGKPEELLLQRKIVTNNSSDQALTDEAQRLNVRYDGATEIRDQNTGEITYRDVMFTAMIDGSPYTISIPDGYSMESALAQKYKEVGIEQPAVQEPVPPRDPSVDQQIRDMFENRVERSAEQLPRNPDDDLLLQAKTKKDKSYAQAVKDGDMAQATKLVDQEASKKGYTKTLFHSTYSVVAEREVWNVGEGHLGTYNQAEQHSLGGLGIYTGGEPLTMLRMKLKLGKVLRVKDQKNNWDQVVRDAVEQGYDTIVYDNQFEPDVPLHRYLREWDEYVDEANDESIDWDNLSDGGKFVRGWSLPMRWSAERFDAIKQGKTADSYIPLNPNNVKSGEPVTRYESGQIIPLSARFDSRKDSLRFQERKVFPKEVDGAIQRRSIDSRDGKLYLPNGKPVTRKNADALISNKSRADRRVENVERLERLEALPDDADVQTVRDAIGIIDSRMTTKEQAINQTKAVIEDSVQYIADINTAVQYVEDSKDSLRTQKNDPVELKLRKELQSFGLEYDSGRWNFVTKTGSLQAVTERDLLNYIGEVEGVTDLDTAKQRADDILNKITKHISLRRKLGMDIVVEDKRNEIDEREARRKELMEGLDPQGGLNNQNLNKFYKNFMKAITKRAEEMKNLFDQLELKVGDIMYTPSGTRVTLIGGLYVNKRTGRISVIGEMTYKGEFSTGGVYLDQLSYIDPTAEDDLLTQRQRFSSPKSKNSKRNRSHALRSDIKRIANQSYGDEASTLLGYTASEMFPEVYKGIQPDSVDISVLSLAQLESLRNYLKSQAKSTYDSETKKNNILVTEKDRPSAVHPDQAYDRRIDRWSHKITQKFIDGFDFMSQQFANLSSMIRMLDGFKYNGTWYENVGKPIMKARERFSAESAKLKKKFGQMKKRRGLRASNLNRAKTIEMNGRMYSESEVVLMSIAGTKVEGEVTEAQQALEASNDLTQDDFDSAIAYVQSEPRLNEYAEFLKEAYEEIYNAVAPAYEKINGTPLRKVINYVPLIRADTMWSEHDTIAPLLEVVSPKGRKLRMGKDARFQTRKQTKGSIIRLDNADVALNTYAMAGANYIAKAETVRDISLALNSPDMIQHLDRVYGKRRAGKIHSLLETMIAREMFASGRTTPMDDWQMMVKDTRNKFTLAQLGGRLITMPKQLVSYLNYMALMSGALSPRFLGRSVVNASSIMSTMVKNARLNAKLFTSGQWEENGYTHLLDGHPLHDELKKYAPHIYDRHGNPETADFEQHGHKGVMAIDIGRIFGKQSGVTLGEFAMSGIKIMDMLAVGTAWQTGFEYLTQQELRENPNMDLETAKINASTAVNQMIADSQPPSLPHERTIGQTDNEYLRSVLPFSGQTMANWQNWLYGVLVPSLKSLKEGNVRQLFRKEGHYSSVAQRLALGFMLPALALGALSRRRWQEDENEMAWDMFWYPMQQTPMFGSTLVYGLTSGWDEIKVEPVPLAVMNDVMKVAIDYRNTLAGEAPFGEREQRNAIEALSVIASFPVAYSTFVHGVATEAMARGGIENVTREGLIDALGLTPKD